MKSMFYKILTLMLFSVVMALAAPTTMTIKTLIGKVEIQKTGQSKWIVGKMGAKIRVNDKLRTLNASEVVLSLNNGSEIRIEEQSLVEIKENSESASGDRTTVQLKRGNLLFQVKKLAKAGDAFRFETPTATAAIRGTTGGLGTDGESMVAFLDEGALELIQKKSNQKQMIGPRELAIETPQGFAIKQLTENQKSWRSTVQQILKDSVLGKGVDSAAFKKILELRDSLAGQDSTAFVISDSTLAAVKIEKGGSFEPFTGNVSANRAQLNGLCKGPAMGVRAGKQIGKIQSGGTWSLEVFWPVTATGIQKFELACLYEQGAVPIGVVELNYVPPVEEYQLDVSTPASLRIVDGRLLVEGKYVGRDAVLRLKLLDQFVDLTSMDGRFRKEFEITDRAGTWDAKEAILTLSGPRGEIQKRFDLDVDKNSKRVNTLLPNFQGRVLADRKELQLSLSQVLNDPTTVVVLAGNEEILNFETTADIPLRTVAMPEGSWDYSVVLSDQAGNRRTIDLGKGEWWSLNSFQVEVTGASGTKVLRVPPLPPGSRPEVMERIQVQLRGLPQNDFRLIQEIVVTNTTSGYFRSLKERQITDTYAEFEVPLVRGRVNKIEVRVSPKTGAIQTQVLELEVLR
jgi:hypothetical protein